MRSGRKDITRITQNLPTEMRFFYHYNKPESKRAGEPRITLHFQGECHVVKDIVVCQPTRARFRKQQPHFVMCGWANKISITRKRALIQ